ncbi:MAG: ribosome maturation factor RimM [Bacteroidales bacterium]|jgi:16S rRNA processing protein RimM
MKTILLGKIKKINGFEGTVTVRTDRNFSGKLPQTESLFLEIDGRAVPFFLKYIEHFPDGSVRMKFEDYDSYEKVKEFIGCNVLLPSSLNEAEDESGSGDLVGFRVLNENGSDIGQIAELIKNPGQFILRVTDDKGKEILLPLHEDLIVEIDPELKQIRMIIPDGLIGLNG